MIFGRGGSGGVINRVSKQADGLTVQSLNLQAGSEDFYRAQADFGKAVNDNLAYRVNVMAENAGSFRDGVGTELRGIAPTVAFGVGESTRIALSAEYFSDERTVDRGIPSYLGKPIETERSTFFGSADESHAETDVTSFDALIEHDMDGAVLRNRTRIADYDKFYQNVFPGAVNSAGSMVSISAYNNLTERQNLFNQTDYIFDIAHGSVTHRMLVGVELGRQETLNYRETGYFGAPGSTATSQSVSVDAPHPTLPIEFRQSAGDADNDGVADTFAVYVQDQLHIGENWQIIAGLRYDRFAMDFTNNRNGVRTEQTDNMLSPRFGLIYQATPDINLYASYSESFVPRAGDQLASLTPSNASLEPEQFVNQEIGMKWQLSQGLFTSLAIYRLDRGNVAITDPDNVGQFLLVDAQRSQGLEWEIGGNVTQTVQLLAGYAYQDAELTETVSSSALDGAQLPLVPEHSGYVWGRWDISPKFGLGLGVNGQSSVYTTTTNAVKLPGFARWDAAMYFNQSDNLKWQLNIENIGDRHYFSSAHNDNNITVGTPRQVKLSAHFDF
jgi:catecholate siderophore receptor